MREIRFTYSGVGTLALAWLISLAGCVAVESREYPDAVKEIRPGILEGYLEKQEYPDSLKLLPPPPEKGSARFARDEEIARASFALRGTERWDQAARDADLLFPAVASVFADALGFTPNEMDTPYLHMLLRRSLADAGLSTYAAKDHYKRKRPFMFNGQPTGTPEEEEFLRKDGSYPSGHTAIGWAWALILCEIVPDRTDAILERGLEFGRSRIICNVHWQSDVDAGRIMGAAAVARLHADEDFLRDLEIAKEEARRMRAGAE